MKALCELNYETPTPIQELAIPKALEGQDLIACAQTGTGKTAAFMLPALQKLSPQKGRGPQVLVLVPTRELAMQVAKETAKFTKHLPHIKTVCIYGGVPYPPQNKALREPHEILIATPGRLIDHMEQGRVSLARVKFFVLDEADRMLDMGFLDPVEQIAEAIGLQRQTLLFSATLDQKIIRVSKKMQKEPLEIRIEPSTRSTVNIEQKVYYVDDFSHKLRLLGHLLKSTIMGQSIIFTATKRQADDLAEQLDEQGYKAAALHGDMNQRQRSRTLDRLRRGQLQILVATDVAARGIDIASLGHVINMNLPYQPDDYVHRIGRTGRAGASGTAITFASYQEERLLNKMAEATGSPITPHTIEGLEPKPKAARRSAPSRGGFKPGRGGPKNRFQKRGFAKGKGRFQRR